MVIRTSVYSSPAAESVLQRVSQFPHRTLVVVSHRAHVVDDDWEALIADGAYRFDPGPSDDAGEAEGVKAPVHERFVPTTTQADGANVLRGGGLLGGSMSGERRRPWFQGVCSGCGRKAEVRVGRSVGGGHTPSSSGAPGRS